MDTMCTQDLWAIKAVQQLLLYLRVHTLSEGARPTPVSYTHLRAHETDSYLVCRLLLEKKKHVITQVTVVQLQAQVKVANLCRRHKNEMFKRIADTWPGLSR